MTRLRASFGRFRGAQSGSATIEFVLVFPFFFMLFLSTFELGMLTARQVMLDRGVDVTVRDIRLGNIAPVTHDAVKQAICDNALILPDCVAQMRLEMRPLDPRAGAQIPARADCVDRTDDAIPVRGFTAGTANQLMVLRACSLFDPYFPSSGLGAALVRTSGDAYALISAASFVVEP